MRFCPDETTPGHAIDAHVLKFARKGDDTRDSSELKGGEESER